MSLAKQGKMPWFKAPAGRKIDRRFLMAGRCAIYMSLGFTMACARIVETGAPFGIAMVACSGPGLSGVFALLGASLGYLLSGGLEWGIRYVAASVLIYTISFVFHELSIYKQSLFMPSASGAVMALTGFLGSFYMPQRQIPIAAEIFLETALAFGGCYFFHEALLIKPKNTESAELIHGISAIIMASCVLMAFSRVELFKVVSLGRFAALLIVMTSAMKGGMLTGAAAGTVLGVAMDISGSGPGFYTMSYAFCGLLSGVFGKNGRFIFVLSFILSSALTVAASWSGDIYISALFEVFCASVVFMLLPAQFLNHLGLMLTFTERGKGEAGLRRFVAKRVQGLSDAYGELYEILRKNITEPYNDENIARVFDRAADEVCIGCKNKNLCWNTEYVDTLSAMNDATQAMIKNGSLQSRDLPDYFRARCIGLPAFVTAVNGELRGLSYRRQLRVKLSENRSLAWGQYGDISNVLGKLAGEIGSVNGSDPLAERRLIRYMKELEADGDASVYRDSGGRLHAVIESQKLPLIVKNPDYMEKLSSVVGVRLCRPNPKLDGESRMTLLEAEPLAVSVGIAALKKRGEKVSGDKGSYFKTDSGVLCVLLSDGMGCGDEAAQDSSQVVSILEKFLRSGLEPATAMKTLNSVMLLRSADSWGFATVDLMCVDLFSGETCFYKYGAAPSYVKDFKGIHRIKGETLAVGLSDAEGIAPDIVRMKLRPGCTAVIASDGVVADSDDQWLKEILAEDTQDMKALAKELIGKAESYYGAEDDMTVVTVQVEERA